MQWLNGWTDVAGMKLATKGKHFIAWETKQPHTDIHFQVHKDDCTDIIGKGIYDVSPTHVTWL